MTISGEKEVRSFIAIPVPDQGIEALQDTVQKLESDIGRSVRWVRPKGIHLTLKFMGDIPAGTVEQVLEALPQVAARFPQSSWLSPDWVSSPIPGVHGCCGLG